jgi:hypothetical protein
MEITFTNVSGFVTDYLPVPASQVIPDWYKNTESYLTGKKEPVMDMDNPGTIKRCMPVFDAITAGYIIKTPVDIWVTQKDGKPFYQWKSTDGLSFHGIDQAPLHPLKNGAPFAKWLNPWSIKVPKGYSILFIQPMHRESVFTIMPGVVDSDEYTPPVNFPFALNDVKFEGLIPAGTPMVQVIPFKRDSWEMKFGGEKEIKEQTGVHHRLRALFFDAYKIKFRSPKEYK